MSISKSALNELKDRTAGKIIEALLKSGWVLDEEIKSERIYRHSDGRRISLHFESDETRYGTSLLKPLFEVIDWSEAEMQEMGLLE